MDFTEQTPVEIEWTLGTKEDIASILDETLEAAGVEVEAVNNLKVSTGGYQLATPRATIVTRVAEDMEQRTYVLFVGVSGDHSSKVDGFWFGSAEEQALRYTAVFWVEHCFNMAIHRTAQRLHSYGMSGGEEAIGQNNQTKYFWSTVIQELERGPFAEPLPEPLIARDYTQGVTLTTEERAAFHARLDRFLREGK